MPNDHVISALANKYRELAGQHVALVDQLNDVTARMEHLAQSIRMFDPSFRAHLLMPKRQKRNSVVFKSGERVRLALEVLRQADKPMTVREIAEAVVRKRGLVDVPSSTVRALRLAITAAFGRYRERGILADDGELVPKWRVV